MKNIKPLTAWSYSALSGYETCPRQHMYRKLMKLDEPKSPALWNGIKVHKEAANFLDRTVDAIPASCHGFYDQMHELRGMNPIVEENWGFDKNWKPTGWMAKNVKCRVSIDAFKIYSDDSADVIDHKTGRYYADNDKYENQLGLYAGAAIKLHPYIKSVTGRLWYLDSGDEVIFEFSRDHALDILEDTEERAEAMMLDLTCAPRPNMFCKWCHFRKDNGGPCEFGG